MGTLPRTTLLTMAVIAGSTAFAADPDGAPRGRAPRAGIAAASSDAEGIGVAAAPAASSAPLLPFRRPDDRGALPRTPWLNGLTMLAVLAVAGWAALRWSRARRGASTRGATRLGSWLGRTFPRAGSSRLGVVQSVRLTPQATVHLVRWDGQEWLLGCTGASVNVLASQRVPASGSDTLRDPAPASTEVRAAPAGPGGGRA